MEKQYCYHGTSNKKIANKILKNGFNQYTYFAKHLEDAIEFGGKYVFRVEFDSSKIPPNWQFRVKEKHPKEKIVSLIKYDQELLFGKK